MDMILPDKLIEILSISITFSIIIMNFIENIKKTNILKNNFQIWLVNFLLSFAISIPFSKTFYDLNWNYGIWVGFFSLMGSSALYDFIKSKISKTNTLKANKKGNIIENQFKHFLSNLDKYLLHVACFSQVLKKNIHLSVKNI